jgi:hypothetical protein
VRGTGNGGRRCKASPKPEADQEDVQSDSYYATYHSRGVIIDWWTCIFGVHLASVSPQVLLHLHEFKLHVLDEMTSTCEVEVSLNPCKFSGLRQLAFVGETAFAFSLRLHLKCEQRHKVA